MIERSTSFTAKPSQVPSGTRLIFGGLGTTRHDFSPFAQKRPPPARPTSSQPLFVGWGSASFVVSQRAVVRRARQFFGRVVGNRLVWWGVCVHKVVLEPVETDRTGAVQARPRLESAWFQRFNLNMVNLLST